MAEAMLYVNWPATPPSLPSFPDADVRDRAYAQWQAEGKSLLNGMCCLVNGELLMLTNDEWRRVGG